MAGLLLDYQHWRASYANLNLGYLLCASAMVPIFTVLVLLGVLDSKTGHPISWELVLTICIWMLLICAYVGKYRSTLGDIDARRRRARVHTSLPMRTPGSGPGPTPNRSKAVLNLDICILLMHLSLIG